MIKIRNLSKSFEEKLVLNCTSYDFELSQVHGIVGLNGAGKTTFFNILAKYINPESGKINLAENKIERNDIVFLETISYFYSDITGNEYLEIFSSSNIQFNLIEINRLFQLPLNEVIETYSTGMKKKLALLSVIKQDKEIYIFDEPFNGLDLETNKSLEIIIELLKEKGKTIFISSHILSPLITVCDKIHLLKQGTFTNSYVKNQFNEIDRELFADFSQRANEILSNAI
ncbi:MAG: ABC transporter ATP-binding protein [Bacteroidia bacterium]